ncbi:unnamed protein product, partial [Pylaiella littoralis]
VLFVHRVSRVEVGLYRLISSRACRWCWCWCWCWCVRWWCGWQRRPSSLRSSLGLFFTWYRRVLHFLRFNWYRRVGTFLLCCHDTTSAQAIRRTTREGAAAYAFSRSAHFI